MERNGPSRPFNGRSIRTSNSHFDRINAFVVHALACFGASGTLKRGQQTLAKLQNENCRFTSQPLEPEALMQPLDGIVTETRFEGHTLG